MESSPDGTSEPASHGPQPLKDLDDENRTLQWQRWWESVMAETRCGGQFCYSRPPNVTKSTDVHTVYVPVNYAPGRQQHYRLPSRSCIMDILYPSSPVTIPGVLSEPPTYVPEDQLHPPATGGNRYPAPSRVSGSSLGAVHQPCSGDHCPLAWAELEDGSDDVPPPPYSRFDIARPRYVAPDTLGRYPRISFVNSLAP